MDENKSVFEILNKVDVSSKTKEKGHLTYLSWSAAWTEVKKLFPDCNYKVIPQIMDDYGNTRFWHDDGKTGWVEVEVEINNFTVRETLAIMNFKNEAIPADQITSTDANKSMKRCLVKALALHGLAIHIYSGEDLPEDVQRAQVLVSEIAKYAEKKSSISEETKKKVAELCKEAEQKAHPDYEENEIRGNYNNINDIDILESLKRKLLAIR